MSNLNFERVCLCMFDMGTTDTQYKCGIVRIKLLLVRDGICLPNADTAVAKTRPRSAITVNVNGIPMNANSMQKPRPALVIGTMLP